MSGADEVGVNDRRARASDTRAGAGDTLARDARLLQLVERGLEQIEQGRPVVVAELCRDTPELASAVADALGLAEALPALGAHAAGAASDRWVGVELAGRYRLEQRIGAGAMGSVYRACDLELLRDVAVKLLHADLFAGPTAQQRFLRESQLLAAIEHPNVLRIYDRGCSTDGVWFLVTELLEGRSLAAILAHAAAAMPSGASSAGFAACDWLRSELGARAQLERGLLRQVVRWAAEVCAGLGAVHERGVCHRDVKPSNVFVRADGSAVLLDFGIATRGGDGALTATGALLGTPWYMPPEAVLGATPDPRGDVYGVGATLYHLLALAPPFEGAPAEVLARLPHDEPPPIQRRHAGLPRDVQAIVEHAIAREPRWRYPSVVALRDDLEAFLAHRPVSVRPRGTLARAAGAVRRRPARALAVLASAIALLLALVALPLWRAAQQREVALRHAELVATVPALVALEGYPDKRLLIGAGEQGTALALLDEILALAPDDAQSRLLRAALRLDAGDHAAAAQDFASLCLLAPGDAYLAAVAERWLHADRARGGHLALDLTGVPEPGSAVGRFAAGFLALRERTGDGNRRALELLTAAGDHPAARDLRVIALLAVGEFQAAHDAAVELRGVYGRRTARTEHAVGAALVALGRYDEAIAPLEESLRLRPERHGPLHNLGIACVRRGELERGIALLEQAHALRPWLWNTLQELALARCQLGEFDAAFALAERIPEQGSLGEAWRRPYAMARVRQEQAIALAAAHGGDAARMAAAARDAVRWFGASAGNGAPIQGSIAASIALMEAFANGDRQPAIAWYAAQIAKAPLSAAHLGNLAVLLPREGGLGASEVDLLRLILLEQAAALAPADPRRRAQADAQRAWLEAESREGR